MYAKSKIGKERVHPKVLLIILNLMSVAPMLRNLRTDLKKKPWDKTDAPAEMRGKWQKRSQEETERQERCARGKAWNLAKNTYKHKVKDKATFYSLSEVWSLPAPSSMTPEEGELVVDSRASMHMLSRKDLNSAELHTVRVSRNPTTLITANGEVQTNEEATVYVYDLDLFVTVQIPRIRPQSYRLDSAKFTDIPMSGPVVKNHAL